MKLTTSLVLAFSFAATAGCATNDKTDIADASVAGQTIHVFREGPKPAAGVMTTLVFKATTGAKPDSIRGWVGLREVPESAKVVAEYDSADSDFDDDITCPDPLPAGAQIWFDVTLAGVTTTASVDIK